MPLPATPAPPVSAKLPRFLLTRRRANTYGRPPIPRFPCRNSPPKILNSFSCLQHRFVLTGCSKVVESLSKHVLWHARKSSSLTRELPNQRQRQHPAGDRQEDAARRRGECERDKAADEARIFDRDRQGAMR